MSKSEKRLARYGGEAGILGEHPQAESHILAKFFDQSASPDVPAFLLDLIDTTESPQGGVASFFGCHPSTEVLLDLLFQVEAQLLGEAIFHSTSAEQGLDVTEKSCC